MRRLNERLSASNYCACFIDLLGQRAALRGQGILPIFSSDDEYQKFLEVVKSSVGDIAWLQEQAERFMRSAEGSPSIRDKLAQQEQALYDEMSKARPNQQRWSDGLVIYHTLGIEEFKCPMNAVMEIFHLSGVLCFLGLSENKPIRGAIEIGWGVELHDNELYGAVIANSYELESQVAQCPRIVVGQATMDYLRAYLNEPPNLDDKLGLYNRNLAAMCIELTAVDQDGHHVINYLGGKFKANVFRDESRTLFEKAYENICVQYEKHKESRDTKLSMRYTWLRGYYHQHRAIHIE